MLARASKPTAPVAADPTEDQFGAFRLMFDHFNRDLFGGKLPPVLLNFSRGPQKTIAFFAPDRWTRGEAKAHEISLNPRHLYDGAAIDTAQNLVHEMAHLWQEVSGKPARTGYHNREWSRKMVDIGLQPINAKTGQPAMSAHSMSDKVIPGGAFEKSFAKLPAAALLPWSCTEAARRLAPVGGVGEGSGEGETGDASGEPGEAPAVNPKNKVKYTCSGCGANVWGKPGLKLGCVDVENHENGEAAIFEVVS